MRNSKIILSIAAIATLGNIANAAEFQVLGAKASSMGGAGIATSPSSLAAYNNPALLANNPEKFSIHVGGGIGIKDTGAGQSISDLSDLDFSALSDAADGNADNLSLAQIDTLNSARSIIMGMDKKGFEANPTADFGLSFGSFGTGLFVTSDIGGLANVDQNRQDLIFETSVPGTYIDILTGNAKTLAEYQASSLHYATQTGTTNVQVAGLAVAEVPLAYGHSFSTGFGAVSVGGAIKLMAGKTFYKEIAVDEDDAFDDIDQNVEDSTTWGVDLGLAFKPSFDESLTLALVGKNLNTPAFDIKDGGEFELDPMVRAGAAYKFGNWVEIAMDADLTENKSLGGYKTRYIGGGVNFDLSVVELNAGLMKNIASGDEAGLIYTAGIATGPDWLHFELSAQMVSKTGEIDGSSYPKQASVNFAISSAW